MTFNENTRSFGVETPRAHRRVSCVGALRGHGIFGPHPSVCRPVDAEYVFDGSGFSVKGTLKTSLHSQCARCAKEFEEPFETKFDERFEKNADEDGECYGFSGEELDVSQMLRDAILLNMQPYSVCRPDCRGLCPVCGCDLNTAQCACAQEAAEEEPPSPFAALRTLLNDDKEV